MQILCISILSALFSILTALGAEHLTKPLSLFGGFLGLRLSYNPDIAFSLALPFPLKELLIGGALVAVLVFAFRSRHEKLASLAFGLILGGAIANLIDRIPDGIVTDFIAVGTFPIFNVADACISIGVGLLFLENRGKKSRMRS